MSSRFQVLLVIVYLLITRLGYCEESNAKSTNSRLSRFGFKSPRFHSPTIKDQSPTAQDASASGDNSKVKNPKKIPSLDEMILFQPSKDGDWSPKELSFADVDFESADGTKLHAWYCPAEKPRAVVLYCHGNAGNIAWMPDFFEYLRSTHRLSVLAFDYRGYGKSKGTPTVEGIIADGRAAREKCAALADVPLHEVVIWGRSMGGAVAVQLASEKRPRALILECTFDSFKSVAKYHAPRWAFLVPDDRLASVQRISLVNCPVFQTHGTADRVVPHKSGQTLFAAANEPKEFVSTPDADHNSPTPLSIYNQIDQFIDQRCPKKVEP